MHLPCTHLRPASITLHLLLSTMMGTLAISGSLIAKFINVVMACSPSIKPSSKFTSIMLAPFSICCFATRRASSYLLSLISLAKRGEPVTLVRSPIMRNWEADARPPTPGPSPVRTGEGGSAPSSVNSDLRGRAGVGASTESPTANSSSPEKYVLCVGATGLRTSPLLFATSLSARI